MTIHQWILVLVSASATLAAAALTLLARPLLQRKNRKPSAEQEMLRALHELAVRVEARLQPAEERLQRSLQAIGEKLDSATPLSADDLAPLSASLAQLHEQVAQLTPPPPSGSSDQVTLEREILAEAWKQFRANHELSAMLDDAAQTKAWGSLLTELASFVPADLQPSYEAVAAPCREYWMLVQKISLIPRIVSGQVPRHQSAAEELRRTRDFATLLGSVQTSSETAGRLRFRFEAWVTDTFLPFADLYLQRYQQAQLDQRDSEWRTGVRIVRDLLRIAAVEPIEVTLGETPFDSTRHIGRSTSNDPRFSDGVITGVVRNGFVEHGQQVIRQPEVIVNRMR